MFVVIQFRNVSFLSLSRKLIIYETVILPVVLYGLKRSLTSGNELEFTLSEHNKSKVVPVLN
jgi:hypothetical protein